MHLAQNLKYLMEQKGLTLTRLSKETGIPKQTIHNWLCGARPGKIEQLIRLARYFETTVEEILIEFKPAIS